MEASIIVGIAVALLVCAVIGYLAGNKSGRSRQEITCGRDLADERQKTSTALQGLHTDLALAQQAQSQLQKQMETIGAKNTQLERDLEEASRQLRAQGSSLSAALAKIENRDAQVADLKHAEEQLRSKQAVDEQLIRCQQEAIGEANQVKNHLDDMRHELAGRDEAMQHLRESLSDANSRIMELQTERSKDRESLAKERQQFEETKHVFRGEFENLANQIFDQKQVTFGEQSKQGLDALLAPFKQQLEGFRQRVDEVHTQNVQGQTILKSELDRMHEANLHITAEASNLTRALKGDKKLQGNWGEQKVEMLLEQSGLRKDFEYEHERNFKTEDNCNQRPDFVIRLPESKHIIIDSKMSLVAYSDYVAAGDEETRQKALASHVTAVRNHINSLSNKNYSELLGINSPDFVLMFIGIEPAYVVVAEHCPSLFEEAYQKRIAIVTSTTLVPVLRVVANLWSLQRQNQSTKLIVDQAAGIYDKLRVFVQKMEILGKQYRALMPTPSTCSKRVKAVS